MFKKLSAACILGASLIGAGAQAEEITAWRLFVSDHADPKVTVLDALSGETIDTFTFKAPTTLYRSKSGKAVFAVQRDGNAVSTISTGISFEDHGDHGDIKIENPKLTGAEFTGERPVHFVEHDRVFATFFDGEGGARLFTESNALKGETQTRAVDAGAPHHGVAVAYGKHHLISVPNPEDPTELPVGIAVLDRSGARVGDVAECPDLHGEAASGNLMIFACATGILVVSEEGGMPQISHLPYPASLPDGKSTTVIGGVGLQYFLGNYGADKLVLIDPTDEGEFRLVDLPMRRVHFAVDPVRPKFAYVFTEDGQLHQLDIVNGEISGSVSLTEPYSMDGHWSDPRPRIAVAGDNVIVTDPLKGKLHLVDAGSFAKAGEIALEGKPYNIVAVGGAGEVHSHGHDHGDEQIYKGYFEDDQIKDRTLADWAGDWQSVYPYLQDGTLDPVMEHKAESGDQTSEEYKAYYEIGYETDVERITINGDKVTFFKDGVPLAATYASDGYEILTYKKGNRGVRFIFKKTDGDAAAPEYIQFSDHRIAPADADHYHLYWGDDRTALLQEVTNWPTYYPSSLNADEIVAEMMAH